MNDDEPQADDPDSVASVRYRGQRSDARQSRRALLEAARELFADKGPDGLTVAAVAKRAGLNRSTAYQHFRSREQLFQAVGYGVASEISRMFGQPRSIGEQIDFFVHYFQDRPDIARLWMFELLNEQNSQAQGWADYVASLERLARSSRSQDGIDAEMLGVIGMTSALVWSLMVRQRSDDPETNRLDTRRFATELKRLFLFGALRPEHWPEIVAEFESGRRQGADSQP